MTSPHTTLLVASRLLVAAGLFLLAWAAYYPGLAGGFLFDDFVNLDAIGRYGDPTHWDVFLRYITSGTADPLGRPISLLSFLFDSTVWPADPRSFLRTNLLIHLGNGALLWTLLHRLGGILGQDGRQRWWSSCLGAGMWMLHPLLVSTTLYAVQRQAMLPATFTLLGLLLYVTGRERMTHRGGRNGFVLMAAGLVGCTVLAALSKANGVLLPLLAGTVEITVMARLPKVPLNGMGALRVARAVFIAVPSVIVLVYLLSFLSDLHAPMPHRDWTIAERLLTEPRVLFDYLVALAVPRPVTSGLFNDAFRVSTGWVSPWTTLPAIAGLLALMALALRYRSRHPAASLAVLFFLAGHSLESTTVPLELYFEHRNYLPAMLLFWPVAIALGNARGLKGWRHAIGALILLGLAVVTWQRADLWGHPDRLALVWAMKNPDSPRARVAAAIGARTRGDAASALRILAPMWAANPGELQLGFNVVDARCASGGLPASDTHALGYALGHAPRVELAANRWLSTVIEVAYARTCPGLDLEVAREWVSALAANPNVRGTRAADEDVAPLAALIDLRGGRPTEAVPLLRRALSANPNPDVVANHVVLLASSGYYDEALAYLNAYHESSARRPSPSSMRWFHHQVLAAQGYWPREFSILRSRLEAEIASRDATR